MSATAYPWRGVQEVTVELRDPLRPEQREVRALSYLDITGSGHVGDDVIITGGAIHKGLGTGGYAFVAAFPGRLPPDPPARPGHIVKARYTPLQTVRLGVDEQQSEYHDLFKDSQSIEGLPVIVADLHSALPAIIAGLRAIRPQTTVAYIMTDGGALPYQFSRSAAGLAEAGWITTAITVGQAYGGDLEAVNIYTGLLAAAHVAKVDVAIVTQGPGNLGTGTYWGFSGTGAGEVLNATHVLGGRPVGTLRVSAADHRDRHYGVSHHSTTVYDRLTHVPATIVVPQFTGAIGERIADQVRPLAAKHRLVWCDVDAYDEPLRNSPVPLHTMGRDYHHDPTPFLAAAAAGGWVGGELLGSQ